MECLLSMDYAPLDRDWFNVLILILMECLLRKEPKDHGLLNQIGLNPYSNGMLT